MMHVVGRILGGLLLLVGAVSLVAGHEQAAETASTAGSTIGITGGAVLGSLPDMVKGFKMAQGESEEGDRPSVNRSSNNRDRDRDGRRSGNRRGR